MLKAHRHEPPVSADEISVVYEDDDLLAVTKPPSIPTHPCGAYRHNSLHSILQATRPDHPQLHIVHRLDRLTSGVVLLAKNAAKAKALSLIIVTICFKMSIVFLTKNALLCYTTLCAADRQVSKTYLARVAGQFPAVFDLASQKKLVSEAKAKCSASLITFLEEGGILISCPLRCLSARDGVWECHEEGKPSETQVRLVRVDKFSSLVKCKPVTGRTHQIRLHLQLLGYPIANDPCYGGQLHYGESVERLKEVEAAKRIKASLPSKDPVDFSTPQKTNESDEEFMRRTCTGCKFSKADELNESLLHCSKIWLHALKYKLDDQVFKTAEPTWAAPSNY
ncbi:hypothetical protein PsorP6_002582 [Peronosclerospora sorghi]|uniref:Uncharacterized protein n=1 Tax=Peronosclerospora sorghi TaxID=230839 RepID=A0ACC0WPD3_9STRA|nr:hypothetical protein PsorP6_002582 [Peronosclerospora sorghi]